MMKTTEKLLKNELNKKLLFVIVLLLIFNCLYGQEEKCTFKDVVKITTHNVPYEKYSANLDMLHKKDNFLGYIGVNRKRLRFTFTSIKSNENNKDIYEVEGFSTVMNKNKRTFRGTFTLLSHYRLTELAFDGDEPLKKGEIEGFSTFSYILKEDEKLSATGTFEGKMLVLWYKDKGEQPDYSSLFDFGDPAGNYKFLGTWTSYKIGKSQECNWGQYRIPCSGDLDIGAAEFSPNPKYYKYGWEDYVP